MIALGGQPFDLAEQILVSCSGAGSCSGGSPSSLPLSRMGLEIPLPRDIWTRRLGAFLGRHGPALVD